MKSTKAVKNVRLFKNAQNGKPKRVTTGVDDYGNRFHVVNGKVKHSRSLSENKKAARKLVTPYKSHHPEDAPTLRHFTSRDRRELLPKIKSPTLTKTELHHYLKGKYHASRGYSKYNPHRSIDAKASNIAATGFAEKLHKGKRKVKDFTK